MELVEYLDETGKSPFGVWFNVLDAQAAAKVSIALTRMEQGNLANTKGDGEKLIILLAGGTKRRQQADIKAAQARWLDYKKRKRGN
jgi:putative component of toxin-antitoxin plasmid stabilization module